MGDLSVHENVREAFCGRTVWGRFVLRAFEGFISIFMRRPNWKRFENVLYLPQFFWESEFWCHLNHSCLTGKQKRKDIWFPSKICHATQTLETKELHKKNRSQGSNWGGVDRGFCHLRIGVWEKRVTVRF